MTRWSAVLLLATFGPAVSLWAQEDDADRYPESSFEEVVRENPCQPASDGYEVKDLLFSLRAGFRPATREEAKERGELIRRWALRLGAGDQAARYTLELRLGEGASARWAAVTPELLADMEKELREGDSAWFYLTFVGCVGQEPAFAIDDFQSLDDSDDGPTSAVV